MVHSPALLRLAYAPHSTRSPGLWSQTRQRQKPCRGASHPLPPHVRRPGLLICYLELWGAGWRRGGPAGPETTVQGSIH